MTPDDDEAVFFAAVVVGACVAICAIIALIGIGFVAKAIGAQ